MSTILATQMVTLTTTLLNAGAITTMSLFDVPEMQHINDASKSLPQLRWLFSRGSHIMPQAAALSAAGFWYLAWDALPASSRTVGTLATTWGRYATKDGYVLAGALALGIAPFTWVMLPVNLRLKAMAEEGPEKAKREVGQEGINELMEKFKWLNFVRAGLMLSGGVLGLWTALSAK